MTKVDSHENFMHDNRDFIKFCTANELKLTYVHQQIQKSSQGLYPGPLTKREENDRGRAWEELGKGKKMWREEKGEEENGKWGSDREPGPT
jgi:hypothetical protein